MSNLGKIAAGVGAVALLMVSVTIGVVILNQGGNGGNGVSSDGGIDVSGTPCDGIGAAREAVMGEYDGRIEKAEGDYINAMEAASDAYWERYRELEDAKYACETDALLADPCADLFERSSALAKEILDNIDSGFDETKAAERERVKKEYDDCLDNPPEEETYEGKKAKCEADFSAGVEAAQSTRDQAESAAEIVRDSAKTDAGQAKDSKLATLAAIEEACNIPPPKTAVTTGGITTGGTGTVVQSGNPACTGNFQGYDPDTQKEINRLQSLLKQAQAGDRQSGWTGAGSYSEKINELRTEMLAGPRKCTADSDCGDTTKVCCSETQVGWVVCSGGECATEKEDCEDEEICSGEPAECVSAATGAESSAIEISRVYIIGSPCNSTIQVLNLQKKDENSVRYEIVGEVPPWLGFSPVGGTLPENVDVTVDCDTLQTPGTYTGSAKILVRDGDGNLINTIPVNVEIEAVRSILDEDDDMISTGGDIDLTDPEEGDAVTTGGDGVIIEEDEEEVSSSEPVSVAPGDVSFTYDHANPTCPLAITPVVITGPAGSSWRLANNLPVWLSMPATSGTVPETINMNFPCRLDRYENQEQSTTLEIEVTTPDNNTETASLKVNGNFTNF